MSESADNVIRRRFDVRGQVQGVGFRPFVYRLAGMHGLSGFVANDAHGAVIEVEGRSAALGAFEADLLEKLPPLAQIVDMARRDAAPVGETTFHIRSSRTDAERRPEVTPDAALCDECRAELFDPADRRYRYAFITCTNCGPRYSIIRAVPYDRPTTTMAPFALCEPCAREYADPADRRFHAQPNACPVCGPQLTLCRPDRSLIEGDAIREAAGLLAERQIVAIKGMGGFHLSCRADADAVVAELRARKIRDGKPLAVMVSDVETAQRICVLTGADVAALRSRAAPIVLAVKRPGHGLADSVAPGCRDFGVMLPYCPAHHLLFAQGLGPVVMTSGNLSGQPLTYEDDDAFESLAVVADAFLTYDRDIFRPIDDSVVFSFRGEVVPIRRARGYAPRPIRLGEGGGGAFPPGSGPRILAVGGESKSCVCLYAGGEAILSEHLGDLVQVEAYRNFVRAVDRLEGLFNFAPQLVAHDSHPQALSARYARSLGIPAIAVQHHHAHIASVMAEWNESGPVIGLACDGAGYGEDGAVWGCEVLRCERGELDRVGHLEYFPLVGGDAAAVETWRPAAALVERGLGADWLDRAGVAFRGVSAEALGVFARQVTGGVKAPSTSSLGRVFDAVSFLTGLCQCNRHEAEAAMALEAAAGDLPAEPYAYGVAERDGRIVMSVVPGVLDILGALRAGEPAERVAARFHETIAAMLVDAAEAACEAARVQTVALSGGCFCNRRLLSRVVELLEERHLRVLHHRRVPTGDGGLSLGQAMVAAWRSAG
ncbi:MAG: carbamoyltransferase HypF [Phycisphaerales bacterium]|nr:MAG: carbamoyltransferase HypF [Phycisphaerales bacterium]